MAFLGFRRIHFARLDRSTHSGQPECDSCTLGVGVLSSLDGFALHAFDGFDK